MADKKRKLDICVLSDIHLGTYGCQALELIYYLNTIETDLLILNGDIIDMWNYKKNFFPDTHMEVIRTFLKMMEEGTKIIYITGNHDEALRKYSDIKLGNLHLVDKYLFQAGGKMHWVFHGDIFDTTTKGYAKIIAKLGGKGYDLLILVNRLLNDFLQFMGREKMSLSKKIKNSVKQAVKFINNFEQTAAELAIDQGYDIVICGHIHQPKNEVFTNEHGSVKYLNSGDWVENLTALEYKNNAWKIHQTEHAEVKDFTYEIDSKLEELERMYQFEDLYDLILK